jgi:hypothetical protein
MAHYLDSQSLKLNKINIWRNENMIINGKNYRVPDLTDFDTVIKLEEQGINLLGIMGDIQNRFASAPLTTLRDVTAIFTGMTKEEAVTEIKTFIENGGSLIDYLTIITDGVDELMKSGEKAGFTKAVKTPQDHKAKSTAKKLSAIN